MWLSGRPFHDRLSEVGRNITINGLHGWLRGMVMRIISGIDCSSWLQPAFLIGGTGVIQRKAGTLECLEPFTGRSWELLKWTIIEVLDQVLQGCLCPQLCRQNVGDTSSWRAIVPANQILSAPCKRWAKGDALVKPDPE